MLKRKVLIFLFTIIILMAACDSGQNIKVGSISSTNLLNVSIENIKINNSIDDVDLTKYKTDDNYEQKTDIYNFKKLRIITDDKGLIIKIVGDISGYVDGGGDGINYSINDSTLFYTIEEIINILGQNYNEYWYDKEQSLKAITYTDKENNINLTFVYDDNGKNLVWIILSE